MNPLHLFVEPSIDFKLYLLFLVVVCIASIVKLARVWWTAPPFRLSRGANDGDYLSLLQSSSASLRRWIGVTFLGWGALISASAYGVCDRLLDEQHIGVATFLVVVADYAEATTMALFVVTLLYLVRWHIEVRFEKLRGTIREEKSPPRVC